MTQVMNTAVHTLVTYIRCGNSSIRTTYFDAKFRTYDAREVKIINSERDCGEYYKSLEILGFRAAWDLERDNQTAGGIVGQFKARCIAVHAGEACAGVG